MRQRPVVLGVLSMVFGGVVALSNLANLTLQRLQGRLQAPMLEFARRRAPPDAPDLTQAFDRVRVVTEELRPITTALSLTKLVLSLLLIWIGYRLYCRSAAARRGALAWSIAALLAIAGEAFVQATVVMPRVQAATRASRFNQPRRWPASTGLNPEQLMRIQGKAAVVGQAIVFAVFPLVLLALLGVPSARDDFVD